MGPFWREVGPFIKLIFASHLGGKLVPSLLGLLYKFFEFVGVASSLVGVFVSLIFHWKRSWSLSRDLLRLLLISEEKLVSLLYFGESYF